jgi:hypothetical protein
MKLKVEKLEFEWPRPRVIVVVMQLALVAGYGVLKYLGYF